MVLQPQGAVSDSNLTEPELAVRLPGGLRHGSSASTFPQYRSAVTRDDDGGDSGSIGDITHLAFAGLSALLVSASATSVQVGYELVVRFWSRTQYACCVLLAVLECSILLARVEFFGVNCCVSS